MDLYFLNDIFFCFSCTPIDTCGRCWRFGLHPGGGEWMSQVRLDSRAREICTKHPLGIYCLAHARTDVAVAHRYVMRIEKKKGKKQTESEILDFQLS